MKNVRFQLQDWPKRLLLLMSAWLFACAVGGVAVGSPVYSSLPITARVVDEGTGQPLEGVIVVVRWQLRTSGPVQNDEAGQIMVTEAVTDAAGNFHLPAWGPKAASPLLHVPEAAPRLVFFKQGYQPKVEGNTITGAEFAGPIIQSEWNGKTIPLKKFTGSEKEWAKEVRFIDTSIDFAFRYDDCSWKYIPRMITAVHREEREFAKKQIPNNVTTLENRERNAALAKCGSFQESLKSYLP